MSKKQTNKNKEFIAEEAFLFATYIARLSLKN